jgi:nicotinamidase-related amidase
MSISNKILLLIDLQTNFKSASDPILIKIVNIEIEKAKRENIPIITVEYIGEGNIVDSIKINLIGYSKLHSVSKTGDDGSQEVHDLLRKIGFNFGQIYVCGVNTDACVRDTINSLYNLNANYRINIISNGCNAFNKESHEKKINQFVNDNKFTILHTIREKPHDYVVIDKMFLSNHMNILI